MSEQTDANQRTQVFRVTIKATLDQVWGELVRTDGLQRAMFNSRMHTPGIQSGAPLRMRSPNGKYTAVAGEFLTVEAPVRLAHTFRFTNYDDPECTVTYDLRQVDDGVELTLTVGDVPLGTRTAKQMSQGGTFIVNNLKAIVETGRPTLTARLLFVLFKLLEPLNPKQTLSTNWPI